MFPLTDVVTSEQLEQQKAAAYKRVQRAERLDRLMKNRDFQAIIMDDFCKEECVRSVELSGDSRMSDRDRADALAVAQSAGHLRRFFFAVSAMGANARNEIVAIEEHLAELREQNADEDAMGVDLGDETAEAGTLS